jgi:four helix bundle protein
MGESFPETYAEWQALVPEEISNDALWRLEVYRLAIFVGDLAWRDIGKLGKDRRLIGLSDQLYRAVGSIGANVAEGYSRQSGKDQARFYEYALGSAREARGWYFQGRYILSENVAMHRIQLLTRIIRLLLTIIPKERGYSMKEEQSAYTTLPTTLLDNIPMP